MPISGDQLLRRAVVVYSNGVKRLVDQACFGLGETTWHHLADDIQQHPTYGLQLVAFPKNLEMNNAGFARCGKRSSEKRRHCRWKGAEAAEKGNAILLVGP